MTKHSRKADESPDETSLKRPKVSGNGWGFLKAPVSSTKAPKNAIDVTQFDGIVPTADENSRKLMKIVAWNVNGLRAVLKKPKEYFRSYVERENPDIICLSETKLNEEAFAKLEELLPQYKYQQWAFAQEKKGYSGTVIFSKVAPLQTDTVLSLPDEQKDIEGRFIGYEFEHFWLVHTYVPNAGMKLDRLDYRTKVWDKALHAKLEEYKQKKPVIWCGDLNVAHWEIDLHNPEGNRNKTPGFTDAERESFSALLEKGYVDVFRHFHPKAQQFTYWSYRNNARQQNKGWRLDYFVVSEQFIPKIDSTFVRDQVVGSDHCPIGVLIDVE